MADILRFPTPEPLAAFTPAPKADLPTDAEAALKAALPAGVAGAPPADLAARAAALDTRSSSIVEAPAGSGKTGLLVQRFLKLLAGEDIASPEEVLAMTFTRKATAEMQQRVLDHLRAAQTSTSLDDSGAAVSPFDRETRLLAEAVVARDRQLGWNLLTQPQRLNIRSILSVCLEIANSLPLLSGGGGPREPVEDADPLHRLAARRTLLRLGGADTALHNALRLVLLHRDGSLANLETLLAQMLDSRDQWGELIPLDPGGLDDARLDREARPRLEHALEAIVCSGLTRALRAMPPILLDRLTALAARFGSTPQWKNNTPLLAICSDKHTPPQARADQLDHWLALIEMLLTKNGTWRRSIDRGKLGHDFDPKTDKPLLEALIAELRDHPLSEPLRETLCAVRKLPPARYPDEQWAVARALFHVLRHALVELKLLFSERGQCDYTELTLAACQALCGAADANESADLALAAGGRLRHLLVDEMQDTSATQYELVRLLTTSWDGHSQTLFLVGDPKQSIYLFRQARVERFLRTLAEARLGDLPLNALRLTANFRSQGALVRAFNDTFGGHHAAGRIFAAAANPATSSISVDGMHQRPGDGQGQDDATPALLDPEVTFVAATPTRAPVAGKAIRWHVSALRPADLDLGTAGASALDSDLPGATPTPAVADRNAPDHSVADHNVAEARQIRALIEQRLALPLPADRSDPSDPQPWRIAVLARAHHHLAAIVQELKAHHGQPAIPFRAVDLDPLDQAPEVLDALALTRALLHPADRVAWLAVLRAPWCGLSLADLLALSGEPTATSAVPAIGPHSTVAALVRARRQHLSPLGQRLLDRTWPTLAAAVATRGRTPLSVQVERTWRTLGGDAALTPVQQSNVLRFLRVLREVESEPGLAALDLLSVLTARLEKLYAAPLPGDAIQVELMTIHKAKGLEWDVVFVPGLHRRPRADRGALLNWIELDNPSADKEPAAEQEPSADKEPSAGREPAAYREASLIVAPIAGKGAESDRLNTWLRSLRTHRERAEDKRLFYVASTRAREQLHLFAALQRKRDGSLQAPAPGSLLSACWPAAAPHFDELAPHFDELAPHFDALNESPFDSPGLLDLPGPLDFPGPPQPLLWQTEPGLALAASAGDPDPGDPDPGDPDPADNSHRLPIERLPLNYDPGARLAEAASRRLPYAPASALAHRAAFLRPEGSFAVRAFGNVVHRYLQVLASRLATASAPQAISSHASVAALLAELPSWEPRLAASLRGEGLAPADASRDAARALRALTLTLNDPVGRWILAPHAFAASEQTLTLAAQPSPANPLPAYPFPAIRSLRIDRTFLAGPAPLSLAPQPPQAGCIWIVDFKTAELGSRSLEAFAAAEIATYQPQLEAYATLRRSLPGGHLPMRLGLYYPLIPRLLDWPPEPPPQPAPASAPASWRAP